MAYIQGIHSDTWHTFRYMVYIQVGTVHSGVWHTLRCMAYIQIMLYIQVGTVCSGTSYTFSCMAYIQIHGIYSGGHCTFRYMIYIRWCTFRWMVYILMWNTFRYTDMFRWVLSMYSGAWYVCAIVSG